MTQQGKLNQAIAVFQKSIERDPKDYRVFTGRALCHQLEGRIPEALADLERAVTLAADERESESIISPGCWRTTPMLATAIPSERSGSATGEVELAPLVANRKTGNAGRGPLPGGRLEGGNRGPDEVDGTRNGGDSNDWFFLAMAHWQLGDKPKRVLVRQGGRMDGKEPAQG